MAVSFHAVFSESNQFNATLLESNNLAASFGEVQYIQVGDYYTGDYTVIPGDESQTLAVAGKLMAQDVIIEAIPSNYGKITWNGSTLTVS